MYFCKKRSWTPLQGRPLYSNHEAGFFMDKMGGFVHIFAKRGVFLVIRFLFLSAQRISSIGQII